MTHSVDETLHGPLPVREEWLEGLREDVIDPDRPIIDAHHHLWTRDYAPYMFDACLKDMYDGHAIAATVYVQCSSMYREQGPEALKPVGEVEFANEMAAKAVSGGYGPTRLCAGIVAAADLALGAAVGPVLDAEMEAGGERFKGVRALTAWSPVPVSSHPNPHAREGMLLETPFRKGVAELAARGLCLEVLVYLWQLPDLLDLAWQFEEMPIIVNHAGGPALAGAGPDERDARMSYWREHMKALAGCGNVYVKIGGLTSRLTGSMLHLHPIPPDSATLAAHFGKFVGPCVEYFGGGRCMFESNFPVDKGQTGYRTLWNAFKRLTASYSEDEKAHLFHDTAKAVYGI